jgi:hypothetical protein
VVRSHGKVDRFLPDHQIAEGFDLRHEVMVSTRNATQNHQTFPPFCLIP